MTGETFGLKAYFGPRGDNLYVLPAALPRWHSHPTLTKPNCSEIGIECFADLLAEGMWPGWHLSNRCGLELRSRAPRLRRNLVRAIAVVNANPVEASGPNLGCKHLMKGRASADHR